MILNKSKKVKIWHKLWQNLAENVISSHFITNYVTFFTSSEPLAVSFSYFCHVTYIFLQHLVSSVDVWNVQFLDESERGAQTTISLISKHLRNISTKKYFPPGKMFILCLCFVKDNHISTAWDHLRGLRHNIRQTTSGWWSVKTISLVANS